MATQLREMAGTRTVPTPASAGGDTARELVGTVFTTAKDLRHIAEQHFSELFVPVEMLADSDRTAVLRMRTATYGALLVHAERERHWHPFRVTRVEAAAERPRP